MDLPSLRECRALLDACRPEDLPELLHRMEADPRATVRALAVSRGRSAERERLACERLTRMMAIQASLHARGIEIVAGVDEVGRGALAGPVTAAAVVLDVRSPVSGVDDSKRLSASRRGELAGRIVRIARAYSVASASPSEIDEVGIAAATRLAWERALAGLDMRVDHVLLDGNDARLDRPVSAIVRGDSSCACIAAASIVAKVHRDDAMTVLAGLHPGYGLDLNKGYGTAEHIEALRALGPSPVHRRSFAPCSQAALF